MNIVLAEIKNELNFVFPTTTEFIKIEKGLKIENKNQSIKVYYSNKRDILRAALIIKSNDVADDYIIEENSDFEDICLMVDCSRNAVRNIATVKKLIRNIAMMGYNALMLYTEDTYEVDNEPMFGYLRGRYTKSEMKELDEYANSLGIELIPCIQTLAHFNQLLRYKYSHFQCFDCADIMLVRDERTYQLIENMLKTLSECFSTKRIHIGMDEAHLLGRGKFLDVNGYVNSFEIISEHLDRVCEIADKYRFEPIIWGDMFYNFGKTCTKFLEDNGCANWSKIAADIPKNLHLCYWEYHYFDKDVYIDKLENYIKLDKELWFAGGTSEAIRGFVPKLTYSCKVAQAAIAAAKQMGVKQLLETVWGDNGAECSLFAQLPNIMHYSYTAKEVSLERLKNEFLTLTGYKYDDFMKLDYADSFCGKFTEDLDNPAKYGLYNDIFLGYVDAIINPEDKKYFKEAGNAICKLRKGQYSYVFSTIYDLNQILYTKYDLGIRIRNAYKNCNKNQLNKCVKDLDNVISKLKIFISTYREQWLKENKPSGLEIQEIRLGGLKERLIGCKQRLKDYLKGKIKDIPELDEILEPSAIKRTKGNGRCDLFSHEAIASVNSFDGFTEVDV